MSDPLLLALDQGTTSTRAILFDAKGTVLAEAGGRMRGLLAGRPDVHRLTPVAATGVPS